MKTLLYGPVLIVPADIPERAIQAMTLHAPAWAQWYWSPDGSCLIARCLPETMAPDTIRRWWSGQSSGPATGRTLPELLATRPASVNPRWGDWFQSQLGSWWEEV